VRDATLDGHLDNVSVLDYNRWLAGKAYAGRCASVKFEFE
jgi:hypothetical protein